MLLYILHCIYCIKSIHFNSCYFFKNIYIYIIKKSVHKKLYLIDY